MRWLPFFILAYVSVGLQLGCASFVSIHGATPNLPLMIVVFVAVSAAREPGLLACFMIGLMHDLVSSRPLGLYAFCYSLCGLVIASTQSVVDRGHPVVHLTLALLAGFVTNLVVYLNGLRFGAHMTVGELIGGALYTALLSVIVVGVLSRLRRLFGFTPPRRNVRSMGRG